MWGNKMPCADGGGVFVVVWREAVVYEKREAVVYEKREAVVYEKREAVVYEKREAVVYEKREAVVYEKREAGVYEKREAVVYEKREAVVYEKREAVVYEKREAVVYEKREAVVYEKREAVVYEKREAGVYEKREAVVYEKREAVVYEKREAVVYEKREAVVYEKREAVVYEKREAAVYEKREAAVYEKREAVVYERCGGGCVGMRWWRRTGVPSQVPSLAATGASLAESIDPALRHVFDGAKGIDDLSHVFDATVSADMWQTRSDPAVPSLFLTSEQDEVVPAHGVLKFAALCAEQQPSRAVRVHRLRGSHVRLLMSDPVAYKQQLHLLLWEAGLDGSAAPHEADEAWQNIGGLSLRDEAPLPSEGEEDASFEGMPSHAEVERGKQREGRTQKRRWRAQEGCVRCLSEPGLRRRLLAVLLLAAAQLNGASPHAEKNSRALVHLCVRLSFSLSLSPGTRVLCRPAAAAPREACVLLLGYGGASFASLRQIDAFYASRLEGCRRVIATRPGVCWGEAAEGTLLPNAAGAGAALEAQRAAIMAAVAGCARLVVHSLSNNGHVLWLELLQSSFSSANTSSYTTTASTSTPYSSFSSANTSSYTTTASTSTPYSSFSSANTSYYTTTATTSTPYSSFSSANTSSYTTTASTSTPYSSFSSANTSSYTTTATTSTPYSSFSSANTSSYTTTATTSTPYSSFSSANTSSYTTTATTSTPYSSFSSANTSSYTTTATTSTPYSSFSSANTSSYTTTATTSTPYSSFSSANTSSYTTTATTSTPYSSFSSANTSFYTTTATTSTPYSSFSSANTSSYTTTACTSTPYSSFSSANTPPPPPLPHPIPPRLLPLFSYTTTASALPPPFTPPSPPPPPPTFSSTTTSTTAPSSSPLTHAPRHQAYAAPLRSILRALIFEGGPALASHMSAAHTERVVLQTIAAASAQLELPLVPKAGAGSFRENAAAFSRGAQVGLAACGANGDVAAAQAAMEPPVRTLFLTGPKDDVVPQEGVRHFAEALGRCTPSRVISIESLDGGHCRHLAADRAKYTSHLEQLLASTMNAE
ncbi:hypothetical protein AB1Y20_016752 [Prymnesium parvum]|uniref:Peptidase S9 prolyl oligopeptidase catalytic domain-containing protein n=1 Tax=Prymnesium parvum TaxID=97485 RepID=A0AB34IBZ5_PRYPA